MKNQEELVDIFSKLLVACDKRLKIVSKDVIEFLVNTIEFDIDKFSVFLNTLTSKKRNGLSCEYREKNNFYDISTASNQLVVKGFFSRQNPYLYFYKNGYEDPFLKLRVTDKNSSKSVLIEYSFDEDTLSTYKQKIDLNRPHYLITDEFVVQPNETSFIEEKYVKIKTRPYSLGTNDFSLSDADVNLQRFYSIIMKCMSASGKEFVPLTTQSAKVLFSNFYNVLNSITTYENEFNLDDDLMILDSVINDGFYFKTDNSAEINFDNIPSEVCSISPYDYVNRKNSLIKVNNNKSVCFINITRSEKYLNLELLGENKKPLCQYIMCSTNSGFTMFRTVKDANYLKPNNISSFTFNLTDNELRLTAVQDNKMGFELGRPIDMIIKLNQNGSIEFLSASHSITCPEPEVGNLDIMNQKAENV